MMPPDPDPEAAAGPGQPDAAPDPVPDPVPDPLSAEEVEVDAPHTGVSVVDDVLAGLAGLERRPVEDRVEAFEQLQQGLRGALDDGPGDPAGA